MATVYLIPTVLDEKGYATIPVYILDAVKDCSIFFVENARTARRYLKQLWNEMVIDDYQWFDLQELKGEWPARFRQQLKEGKNIGIISEAGCPGVADPGQQLVAIAQEGNHVVRPLTGPSSILLALMASGMNGQHFKFIGYLPIDRTERGKAIREIETEATKKSCTQIFIETPYRNNQLIEALLQQCQPSTRLCIAVELTGEKEWVKTKTIGEWRKEKIDIHKRTAIFVLGS
ncbi:MAG: SAM-dependent methyltransferase [Pedobacter sp.]|nr:MAG: SAM-dependent methyltransferase [Pedobacter sp.]